MLIVICGIMAGILISYWIDQYYLGPTSIFWTAIFIAGIVIAAVMGVIYDSYATSVESVPAPPSWILFGKEVVESFLIPFVAGAAIGVFFFQLGVSKTFSEAPVAAASVLIFALVIVFFAATERQYG